VDDSVALFQECVDALNRVDRAELTRLVDPEVVFLPMRAAVSGPYIGHAGLEAFLSENDELYEYFRADFDQFERLPDGRLLCVGRIRVRDRVGAQELDVQSAGIAAFRDGRMISWHDYGDEKTARAKAGA
jgi:ketosteroid isomerase-like protein